MKDRNSLYEAVLKSKIGYKAGKIWQFLYTNGKKSFSEIEKALSIKKPVKYSTILLILILSGYYLFVFLTLWQILKNL